MIDQHRKQFNQEYRLETEGPHPVELTYAPGVSAAAAVRDALRRAGGHVLCFLPGVFEIAKVQAQGAVAEALAAFGQKAAALEGTPPAAGGGRGCAAVALGRPGGGYLPAGAGGRGARPALRP